MRIKLTILSGLALLATAAMAEPSKAHADQDDAVLVELFTSQSCSSCPAAERFFNKLSTEDGIVAIQWHVDYWNSLVHGRDGRWKDPYSSASSTQRQRDYNHMLRGVGSVYTPQAIVGGMTETTGSRASSVRRLVQRSPEADATINFRVDEAGYQIEISPKGDVIPTDAEAVLITLLKHEETEIKGGENKGLVTRARNIAVQADTLGPWSGTEQMFTATTMAENYTCAVIVQEKNMGRVLAASYCPS